MAPSVYAVASSPPTWERQLSAAVLSRPRAIVGGQAAASLHNLSGFSSPRPVIIVPRTGNARSPLARVIRSAFFKTIEVQRIRGFVTSTPAETLFTFAARLPEPRLSAVVEETLLTGKADLASIDRVFERVDGARMRGTARLRRIVEDRHPTEYGVDSTYLERMLERVLADSRLPYSIREFPMSINGSPARVDALVPDWDLVVEADSRRWHARQTDFEADRDRDNALAASGLQVVRFTYSMLKQDPERCLNTLVSIGGHRRARSTA